MIIQQNDTTEVLKALTPLVIENYIKRRQSVLCNHPRFWADELALDLGGLENDFYKGIKGMMDAADDRYRKVVAILA